MANSFSYKKKLMILIITIASSTSFSQDSVPVTDTTTKEFLSTLDNNGLKRYLKSLPTDQDLDIIAPAKKIFKLKTMPEKKASLASELDRYLYLTKAFLEQNKLPSQSPITSNFFIEKMNIVDNPTGKSLFEHIIKHNPSMTAAGKLNLVALLTSATKDTALLQKRQKFIAFLVKHKAFCEKIKSLSRQIKQAEPYILSFFAPKKELNPIEEINYSLSFENLIGLKNLNKYSLALSAKYIGLSPKLIAGLALVATALLLTQILGNIGPHLEHLGPQDITARKVAQILLKASPSIVASAVQSSVELAILPAKMAYDIPALVLPAATFKIVTLTYLSVFGIIELNDFQAYITRIAQKFSPLIIALKNSYQALLPAKEYLKSLVSLDSLHELVRQQKSATQRSIAFAQDKGIQQGSVPFAFGKGTAIAFINNLLEARPELAAALCDFGTIEMYVALADLYRERQNSAAPYCFAEYVTAEKPVIIMDDFWNPFIDPQKVVTNSLALGGAQPANIIVTGPNTGGKTTILKSLSYNILLAQTCGIAAAKKCVITPFSKILCQLNVTDDLANGVSLFKAEALHAKQLNTEIESLAQNEFCFVVMDEAFRGTNAEEGQEISIDFAQQLALYPNALTITATHYSKLGLLPNFGQWHVEVIIHPDNKGYTRTFKIKPGASTLNIARKILQEESILHNK